MSKILGPQQTIALAERLREFVRDIADREEKLTREVRGKISLEKQRRDKAIEEIEADLSAVVAREEAAFAEAQTQLDTRFQKREARIAKAQFAARKGLLKWIENREDSRKNKLQTNTLQAHRTKEATLAKVQKTCEEFSKKLFPEEDKLAPLEELATKSFAGYGRLRKALKTPVTLTEAETAQDEYAAFADLQNHLRTAEDELSRFRRSPLPHLFRARWWLAVLVLLLIPAVPLANRYAGTAYTYEQAGMLSGGILLFGIVVQQLSQVLSAKRARKISDSLGRSRLLIDLCRAKAEKRFKEDYEQAVNEYNARIQTIETEWAAAVEAANKERETRPCELDQKHTRIKNKHAQWLTRSKEELNAAHASRIDHARGEASQKKARIDNDYREREARLNADLESRLENMRIEWQQVVPNLLATISETRSSAQELFPPWSAETLAGWKSPERFAHASKLADWQIDLAQAAGGLPKDERFALDETQLSLPVTLTYPQEGSLLIETNETGHPGAIGALNNSILRLLSVASPGRLSFTIIDPVGLGQNFAGVMHLADYAEHVINRKIWTQAGQIEQRLGELNEHMEKVIQMYLRNDYATIAEYNEQAGNIAEKYHFVVIADFPANFTEIAARRLISIASSGARCGVYTLIHWNASQPIPPDFGIDELKRSSVCINARGDRLFFAGKTIPGSNIRLEQSPAPEALTEFINRIGSANRDSNRIEVPFSQVAPTDEKLWSEDTTTELRVPIGRTGATKLQYLEMGRGTRQHALLAGKTGSGKSTLFHVLITNLALWCSPEQVEFYLIDFKKGVEFKCYAAHKLPHARVVAIESDRDFGLSVLQRLDEELRRRGELFRKLGVQDLAGYKRAGGTEAMPRSLLIIDEFQEFFVEDDKISQSASMLLDRIVRQGRAFGIHVFLGSQTLGGAYTMARSTIGQMVIRIALQCNEADAYLIMDDSNPAPRLLTRPGEGIYNDEAGALHGNSPFQTVWLPDDVRDSYLEKVQSHTQSSGKAYPAPVVFEGNAPASVADNEVLQQMLQRTDRSTASAPRIFLGAPNAIKGPTEIVFQRQGGNQLLIVGQNEEALLAMLSVGLISLAAQNRREAFKSYVIDSNPTGSSPRTYLDDVITRTSREITMVRPSDVTALFSELVTELKRRQEDEKAAEAPAVFVIVQGLQKFTKLRYEDDFGFSSDDAGEANPSKLLNTLICEGASVGIHVIASVDSYNNVNRFLSKKAQSEFGLRVLFQMSANDSASLIDNPKAGTLGMHRALFYNEKEGHLETFRPYALPEASWLVKVGTLLSRP